MFVLSNAWYRFRQYFEKWSESTVGSYNCNYLPTPLLPRYRDTLCDTFGLIVLYTRHIDTVEYIQIYKCSFSVKNGSTNHDC